MSSGHPDPINSPPPMRIRSASKHFHSFAVMAVALAMIGFLTRTRPTSAQSITLERKVLEMGTVEGGQNAEGRISFRNHTRSPLTLLTFPCCGVSTRSEPPTLGPGEAGELIVVVDAPMNSGPFTREIRVGARELPQFSDAIEVRLRVAPRWRLSPSTLDFGTVREGETVWKRLKVYADAGAPVPGSIRSSKQQVIVRAVPQRESVCYEYDVGVSVPAGSHDSLDATLALEGRNDHQPRSEIDVRARVEPCADLSSDAFRLGEFARRSKRTSTLSLARGDGLTVRLLQAPAWAEVFTRQVSPSKAVVQLKVGPEAPSVIADEVMLQITTDHTFTIHVPVLGVVRDEE